MRLADRLAVMPPEAGDVDELGVGLEERGELVGIACVPGLGEGVGHVFGTSHKYSGPSSEDRVFRFIGISLCASSRLHLAPEPAARPQRSSGGLIRASMSYGSS